MGIAQSIINGTYDLTPPKPTRATCPKCGSTSQVELVWRDSYSYSTTHIKEYKCGCGCHFEIVLEYSRTNIYEDE